jgi:hypothetical protein
VPNVMKSGSLNLLEPSGPHRACYGTPLPCTYKVKLKKISVPCQRHEGTWGVEV